MAPKLKLAVWKFSSCDGCQLSLLDCEDQLLAVAEAVEIAYFLEASSRRLRGPYDVSLVEGSVATAHDVERLKEIRDKSGLLVAIGACAVAGGVQALRNFGDLEEMLGAVYPRPEAVELLPASTALTDHVKVDLELRGCPISKTQLLEVVGALVHGRRPDLIQGSVCLECKLAGVTCLLVSAGEPCLGPVTQAGCGALCPGRDRPCFGCFGPQESANPAALARTFLERLGLSQAQVLRLFRGVNSQATAFLEESKRHETPHQG